MVHEVAGDQRLLAARHDPHADVTGRMAQSRDETDLLADPVIGFDEIDCYYHTFLHPMDRPADIVQWYRATGLRPFLDALPAQRHEEFLDAYRHRLEQAYATTGPLTFHFRRLFIWGRRSGN